MEERKEFEEIVSISLARIDKFSVFYPYILNPHSRNTAYYARTDICLLGALEVVAATADNSVVEELVRAAASQVTRGETLSAPLEAADLFPLMFVHMVEVGEKSGTLDSTLVKLADFFDEEVSFAVADSMALLEPFLLVVIGGLVGILIIALYLPVFQMGALV